jgi:hypothetical protein
MNRSNQRRFSSGVLVVAALSGVLLVLSGVQAESRLPQPSPEQLRAFEEYKQAIAKTAGMVGDQEVQKLAQKYGLQALNLTWEDTGRYKNSAVGPNISDMTIQVKQKDPRTGQELRTCMPVIRFPNFEDKSADLDPAKFFLLTGNEKGRDLNRVDLREFLGNVRKYLAKPDSWKGDRTYLHANRDNHVLVSAQACFLPVPKQGIAELNPVLFNYQSMANDPGVLSILVTRQGTSVTVIDNKRDATSGSAWGQRLYFNNNGQKACLTGQRLSDFTGTSVDPTKPQTPEAAGQSGLNMVLLIQVPLKQKKPMTFGTDTGCEPLCCCAKAETRWSDVEIAVIGHGKDEGPFIEMDNLDIERDHRFPVRVTVQFYKATSNGVVTEQDLREIKEQIDKVYAQGDYVGSLVTEGHTGRPTEYDGDKVQPPEWWEKFWERHFANTGYTRDEVVKLARQEKGEEWFPMTERELADMASSLPYESRLALRLWKRFGGFAIGGLVLLGFLFVARGRRPVSQAAA